MSLHPLLRVLAADGSTWIAAGDLAEGDLLFSLDPFHENRVLLVDPVRRGRRRFVLDPDDDGRPLFTEDAMALTALGRRTSANPAEALRRRHPRQCESFSKCPALALEGLATSSGTAAWTDWTSRPPLSDPPGDQDAEDRDATLVGLVTSRGHACVATSSGQVLVLDAELVDADAHPFLVVLVASMLEDLELPEDAPSPETWTGRTRTAFFHECLSHAVHVLEEWPETSVALATLADLKRLSFLEQVRRDRRILRLAESWWSEFWTDLEAMEAFLFWFCRGGGDDVRSGTPDFPPAAADDHPPLF